LCLQICDEPVITGCGCENLYCKKCLEFRYNNQKHTCPQCNKETGDPTFLKFISSTIKEKKMKCANYCVQCTWEGKLSEYLNHIQYQCPKKQSIVQIKDVL